MFGLGTPCEYKRQVLVSDYYAEILTLSIE